MWAGWSDCNAHIAGVAGGATRAALTQHFALAGNAADISAKEGSQVGRLKYIIECSFEAPDMQDVSPMHLHSWDRGCLHAKQLQQLQERAQILRCRAADDESSSSRHPWHGAGDSHHPHRHGCGHGSAQDGLRYVKRKQSTGCLMSAHRPGCPHGFICQEFTRSRDA